LRGGIKNMQKIITDKKMRVKNGRYCKKGGVNPALSQIGRSE